MFQKRSSEAILFFEYENFGKIRPLFYKNSDFIYEIQFWGFGSKSFAQNCFGLVSFEFWGFVPKLTGLIIT